ncbi:hypothetical protein [Streptacidiphilus sp. PAMC 29251]
MSEREPSPPAAHQAAAQLPQVTAAAVASIRARAALLYTRLVGVGVWRPLGAAPAPGHRTTPSGLRG